MKNKLIIKEASVDDENTIFNLILEGTKSNSFNKLYKEKYTHKTLLFQIQTTINHHIIPISKEKTLPAIMYVLKEYNNTIGFIWLRYHTVDTCELYMASLLSNKRNNGYGYFFFEETIKLISKKFIYADIYHNSSSSEIMKNILLKLKFNETKSDRQETFRFTRA